MPYMSARVDPHRIFVIFLLRGNFGSKFGLVIEEVLRIQKIIMDQIRTPYLGLKLEMTKWT